MKQETKIRIISSVLYGIFFGVVLTITGSIINNGKIIWSQFPVGFCSSTLIGTIMGILVPGGKLSGIVAGKVAKPGTFLYRLVFYSILMIIILLYMCPLMTIFNGCILGGATIVAVIPYMFTLAGPFFIICVLLLLLVGDPILEWSVKITNRI